MIAKERIVDAFNGFEEDEFEIKWLHIGKFLRSMTINTSCCREYNCERKIMANREELGANEAKITSQDFPHYNVQSKSKWEGGGKT